jgi:hypothetical protein
MKAARIGLCYLLALAACGSQAVTPSAGNDGGAADDSAGDGGAVDHGMSDRVPVQHRAQAAACPTDRAPGGCPYKGSTISSCLADSDCSDGGTNGRCQSVYASGAGVCMCTYDACFSDADCHTTELCLCVSSGNRCVPANCRADADCGPGSFCSPSIGDCGAVYGVHGYYCHGPNDTCVDDADCPTMPGQVEGACFYDRTTGAWHCANLSCPG